MPAYNPSSGYQTFTPDPQNMSIAEVDHVDVPEPEKTEEQIEED